MFRFSFEDSSRPITADELQVKVTEILEAFQTGAIIHCGSYFIN